MIIRQRDTECLSHARAEIRKTGWFNSCPVFRYMDVISSAEINYPVLVLQSCTKLLFGAIICIFYPSDISTFFTAAMAVKL